MYKSISYNGCKIPKTEYFGYEFLGKKLSPMAERYIYRWANTDRQYTYDNKYSFTNFINGMKEIDSSVDIKNNMDEFEKLCSKMKSDCERRKEEKKVYNKEHKEEIEKIKSSEKEEYGYAIIDGEKVQLAGYMVEEMNALIVRGGDKRMFCFKYPTTEKDITINVINDEECKKRLIEKGFNVVSKKDVDWIVSYKIRLSGGFPPITKSIRPSATFKGQIKNTEHKHEKALNLLRHFAEFDEKIKEELNSKFKRNREIALATWMVKTYAIRIGNEREEFQADTVGVTTLKIKNIKVFEKNDNYILKLDFLGKDSVPYSKTDKIPRDIYNHFVNQIKDKKPNDELFSISSNDVSKFIKSIYKDASPKTFRSAIGSAVLCESINKAKIKSNMKDFEKKQIFVKANADVALYLNHQKGTTAKGEESFKKNMEKMSDKISTLKKNLSLEEENFKNKKKYLSVKIKHCKEKGLKASEEKYRTQLEKAKSKVERIKESLERASVNKDIKSEGKNIALGTSLNSYCSPKVVYSICKDMDLDPSKIYTKTQMNKFESFNDVSSKYWKNYLGFIEN